MSNTNAASYWHPEALKLFKDGHTVTDIANHYGKSEMRVLHVLKGYRTPYNDPPKTRAEARVFAGMTPYNDRRSRKPAPAEASLVDGHAIAPTLRCKRQRSMRNGGNVDYRQVSINMHESHYKFIAEEAKRRDISMSAMASLLFEKAIGG